MICANSDAGKRRGKWERKHVRKGLIRGLLQWLVRQVLQLVGRGQSTVLVQSLHMMHMGQL